MAKDAFYFSHDANARHDQKVLEMRSVYGNAGYGCFWILIEMMREANEYKLDISSKYAFHGLSKQLDCDIEFAKEFISDCINEFNLFESDGESFWSDSLKSRMEMYDEKSAKAKELANRRWKKEKADANAMPTHMPNECEGNAIISNQIISNNIKSKLDIEEADIFAIYQQEIGILSPITSEKLDDWMKQLSPSVVKYAIEIAVSNSSRKFAYIEAILKSWHEQGAKSVDDCKALQLDHKRKQHKPTKIKSKIEVVESTTPQVSDDEYNDILAKYGLG